MYLPKRGFYHPVAVLTLAAITLSIAIIFYLNSSVLFKPPKTAVSPGPSASAIPRDETANWKTYHSKNFNLEIKYPGNWLLEDYIAPGEVLLLKIHNPPEERVLTITQDAVIGAPPNVVEKTKITVSGNEFEKDVYKGYISIDDGKIISADVSGFIVTHQGPKETVIRATWKTEDSEAEVIFDQVVQTLRFL